MWRLWSCPEPGDESWSHGTHGGYGATLCQEAGAGATGRVAALELPRAGTQELGPRDTWAHLSARLALCLDLELVCGVPDL
jgi:hypothetical protein